MSVILQVLLLAAVTAPPPATADACPPAAAESRQQGLWRDDVPALKFLSGYRLTSAGVGESRAASEDKRRRVLVDVLAKGTWSTELERWARIETVDVDKYVRRFDGSRLDSNNMPCDFFLLPAGAESEILCVAINNSDLRRERTWAILQSLVLTTPPDATDSPNDTLYRMLRAALAHLPEFAKLERNVQASKSLGSAAASLDALFKRCAGASAKMAVQCSAWIYTSTRLMQVMPSGSNERWRYQALRRFTDKRFWEVRLAKILGSLRQKEKCTLLGLLGASQDEAGVTLPLLAQVEELDQQKIYCGPFAGGETNTVQGYSSVLDEVASRLTCVDLSLGRQPEHQLWRVARAAWSLDPGRELGMYLESCARAKDKEPEDIEPLVEALKQLAMQHPRQAGILRALSKRLSEQDWETVHGWCQQTRNQASWKQEVAEMQRRNRELLAVDRGEGLKSLEQTNPCAGYIQTTEISHSAAFLGRDGQCVRLDYASPSSLVPTARQLRPGQWEQLAENEEQALPKLVALPAFGLPLGVIELHRGEETRPPIAQSSSRPAMVADTGVDEPGEPPPSHSGEPPIPGEREARSMLLSPSWRSEMSTPPAPGVASWGPSGTRRFVPTTSRAIKQRTTALFPGGWEQARRMSTNSTLHELGRSEVLRTDIRALFESFVGTLSTRLPVGERLLEARFEPPRVSFTYEQRAGVSRVARWRIWAPVQPASQATTDASIYLALTLDPRELQASKSHLLTQGDVVAVYADETAGHVVIRFEATQFIGSTGRDVELWLGPPEAAPAFSQTPVMPSEIPQELN